MQKQELSTLLAQNTYPGRGIVLGCLEGGTKAAMAYFIMGRSPNSRNRVFTEKDGGIITEAASLAAMQDPSLIIYAPVRKCGQSTIVSNGEQTDTIFDCLAAGICFEDALRTRTFEPDAPHYTPRISGVVTQKDDGFAYQLSIVKSADGVASSTQHFFFDYTQPLAGEGHLIHTYRGDGNPLPSFSGEPVPVGIGNEIDSFGQEIWQALNTENKVALFVRFIGLDGTEETRIYNRFSKV